MVQILQRGKGGGGGVYHNQHGLALIDNIPKAELRKAGTEQHGSATMCMVLVGRLHMQSRASNYLPGNRHAAHLQRGLLRGPIDIQPKCWVLCKRLEGCAGLQTLQHTATLWSRLFSMTGTYLSLPPFDARLAIHAPHDLAMDQGEWRSHEFGHAPIHI